MAVGEWIYGKQKSRGHALFYVLVWSQRIGVFNIGWSGPQTWVKNKNGSARGLSWCLHRLKGDIWRFLRQAGGSGISNKSLTRQRRRARPAAINGVLER